MLSDNIKSSKKGCILTIDEFKIKCDNKISEIYNIIKNMNKKK